MSDKITWLKVTEREFVGNDPATATAWYEIEVHINVAHIVKMTDSPGSGNRNPGPGERTKISLIDGTSYSAKEGIDSLKKRMAGE